MNNLCIAAFLVPIGGITLLIGLINGIRMLSFVGGAHHAKGTVTHMRAGRSGSGGTVAPVFSFTANDQKFEVASKMYSNRSKLKVGQDVDVLYAPHDPNHARINQASQLWLGTWITGGIGLVVLLLGIGVLFIKG